MCCNWKQFCVCLMSGNVAENDPGNSDGTHFINDVDSGKKLLISSCNVVKYEEVLTGGEG